MLERELNLLRDELRKHKSFEGIPRIIIDKLIEGLDAKETKTASHSGTIIYSEPMIDWPVRLNYLKFVCILGGFGPNGMDDDGPDNLELSHEQLESKAKEILRQLGIGRLTLGPDEGTGRNPRSPKAKKRAE